MDNQHRAIKGYRELSQAEIDRMNEIKELAERVGKLCDSLMPPNFGIDVDMAEESDPRWVHIGRTQLQQGFMALTRAVAKPESF